MEKAPPEAPTLSASSVTKQCFLKHLSSGNPTGNTLSPSGPTAASTPPPSVLLYPLPAVWPGDGGAGQRPLASGRSRERSPAASQGWGCRCSHAPAVTAPRSTASPHLLELRYSTAAAASGKSRPLPRSSGLHWLQRATLLPPAAHWLAQPPADQRENLATARLQAAHRALAAGRARHGTWTQVKIRGRGANVREAGGWQREHARVVSEKLEADNLQLISERWSQQAKPVLACGNSPQYLAGMNATCQGLLNFLTLSSDKTYLAGRS